MTLRAIVANLCNLRHRGQHMIHVFTEKARRHKNK